MGGRRSDGAYLNRNDSALFLIMNEPNKHAGEEKAATQTPHLQSHPGDINLSEFIDLRIGNSLHFTGIKICSPGFGIVIFREVLSTECDLRFS